MSLKHTSNGQLSLNFENCKDSAYKNADLRKKAISTLEQVIAFLNKKEHPNLPDYARVVKKYSDTTANGLTACIIDWLRANGWQAERVAVMGRQTAQGKWIKSTGTRGSSDISATIRGRSVKIEVKIGRDVQSDAQKKYQYDTERAGGVYIIAKDFGSFFEWYNKFMEL